MGMHNQKPTKVPAQQGSVRWSWDLWDEPWDEPWDELCSLSHLLVQLSAEGQVVAFQDDELLRQLLPVALQGPQALPQGISLLRDPGTAQLQLLHSALQGLELHRGGSRIRRGPGQQQAQGDDFMGAPGIWGAGGGEFCSV